MLGLPFEDFEHGRVAVPKSQHSDRYVNLLRGATGDWDMLGNMAVIRGVWL